MNTFQTLEKTQTGIASEFFVAGELARRGFNVTLTFGNTKSIDLIVEKATKLIPIQVKGIQRRKSVGWNITKSKLQENVVYVLINLHADTLEPPEYFVLTSKDLNEHLKEVKSGRDYIGYNYVLNSNFKNRWDKI
jgi:hypothetical protein